MIVPGSAHALLLSSGSYIIPYALRIRASNNAYLNRTFLVDGNRTKFTWSAWIKRGSNIGVAGSKNLFMAQVGGSSTRVTRIYFDGDVIRFDNEDSTGGVSYTTAQSTAVFRDPSAWYHFVLAVDTSDATSANRVKIYVNGSQVTLTGTYPALNANTCINFSVPHSMGCYGTGGGTEQFDGYMAEINFVNNQALTPSSFGETNNETGVWVPIKYVGAYGTTGFYLRFANAVSTTTISQDSSGNGNNWTSNGISVTSGVTYDQMTDTPTLNYAVWNPLDTRGGAVPTNANMNPGVGNSQGVRGTFGVTSGKWYWEHTLVTASTDYVVGIGNQNPFGTYVGSNTDSVGYFSASGEVRRNASVIFTYGTWNTSGKVVGFALDQDAGTLQLFVDGVSQGSAFSHSLTGTIFPMINFGTGYGTPVGAINFGQRAFAYTPPSGFKALNTANLATPSIKNGSLYMDATLRTGTGATASVSSLGFQPDFVWIKSRSNATAHNLFNSVIGATKGIQTTGPNAQYTDVNSLTSFNSNGYSLGSDASSRGVNINTNTYVNWAWKESTTAGLDILSWTGNGAGPRTINHALGVTPEFMMLRGTDARAWACWFNSMTSAAYYMDLGTAAAEFLDTTMFDSTAPTSTTFRVGSYNNVNAITYVGYFFSSISGFSRIGSYTGNASTDGPFVWCGFSPKFVMVKGVDIATGWFMVNPSNSANEVVVRVFSDTTGAETSNTYGLDLLSNGFKVRAPSGYSLNNSGNKYAFIAFAENPFKYSRAR